MDGMTQPPMPTGAPQEGGKKKAVLWIVLVVLALAIIAVWLAMGSPKTIDEAKEALQVNLAPLTPSTDAELNAIGSDLGNINAGNPSADFQPIDEDLKAL